MSSIKSPEKQVSLKHFFKTAAPSDITYDKVLADEPCLQKDHQELGPNSNDSENEFVAYRSSKIKKRTTIVDDPVFEVQEKENKFGHSSKIPKFSHLDTKLYKNTSSLSIASILEKTNENYNTVNSTKVIDLYDIYEETCNTTSRENMEDDGASVERYSFLVNILDENKRPPSDLEYDARTLYIPQSAYSKFTPFEKQYWDIKKKLFDTVVFFKKGKFYELYEKDAEIASSQFDLKLTDRVNMKMAGVPEASLEMWCQRFVNNGYKVAIVKQLENQIGKELRKKASENETGSSKHKEDSSIIRREVTCVLTSATLTDPLMISSDFSSFVMAIKQETYQASIAYSAVFIDVSTSSLFYCKFEDDSRQYYLETLLLQVRPKEVLFEKGLIPAPTLSFVQKILPSASYIFLRSEEEFYSVERCMNELDKGGYFKNINTTEDKHYLEGTFLGYNLDSYPRSMDEILKDSMLSCSFGAIVYYLKYLHMDQSIIPRLKIFPYDLFPKLCKASRGQTSTLSSPILGLDGSSLLNLEIFQNSVDGSEDGTLFQALDHCLTPMGRRKLKYWTTHPLTSVSQIKARLDSVALLSKEGSSLEKFIASYLKGQPDIERLLSRALSKQARLKEYVQLLDSLAVLLSFFGNLKLYLEKHYASLDDDLKQSKLYMLAFNESFNVDDLESFLTNLRNSFDRKSALDQGELKLNPGQHSDQAYLDIEKTIASLEKEFESYAIQKRKELRCSDIRYKDIGHAIYQLEIPTKACSNLSGDFLLMSKTKHVQRYWTSFIKEKVKQLEQAKEMRASYLSNLLSTLLERFNENSDAWQLVTEHVAEIDCLYSLYKFKENRLQTCCAPVISDNIPPLFHANDLGHYIRNPNQAHNFISNDVFLGNYDGNDENKDTLNPQAVILTGPNMGGKSTLLRQICLCVILAQLGSYVPASKLVMSVFDRIFTRIGAQDNILAGKSTFKVELEETSRILNEATENSLVILDELGRGTSTLDGHAVAYSVFHNLISRIGCITLFSTHYRQLTYDFMTIITSSTPKSLGLWHMSCIVDEKSKEVVFLYKLASGICPQSYGMNVARLSGIPQSVVERAYILSEQLKLEKPIEHIDTASNPSFLPFDISKVFENDDPKAIKLINKLY